MENMQNMKKDGRAKTGNRKKRNTSMKLDSLWWGGFDCLEPARGQKKNKRKDRIEEQNRDPKGGRDKTKKTD